MTWLPLTKLSPIIKRWLWLNLNGSTMILTLHSLMTLVSTLIYSRLYPVRIKKCSKCLRWVRTKKSFALRSGTKTSLQPKLSQRKRAMCSSTTSPTVNQFWWKRRIHLRYFRVLWSLSTRPLALEVPDPNSSSYTTSWSWQSNQYSKWRRLTQMSRLRHWSFFSKKTLWRDPLIRSLRW